MLSFNRRGWVLWLAQGFYAGRIPFAPGTFGSVLGLGWYLLLLSLGTVWGYAAGLAAGIMASVWICGEAERILGEKDSGSIVLDEIAAMPVCFAGWMAWGWFTGEGWPRVEDLWSGEGAMLLGGAFIGFRIFDIWKPWPVWGCQKLAGGWGVVADDVGAALYVGLAGLLCRWLFSL